MGRTVRGHEDEASNAGRTGPGREDEAAAIESTDNFFPISSP